jgi:hypothetical protein
VLILIFSILAVIGAYLAFNQVLFWPCSVSAFFGMLSFGFGLGFFTGLIALIMILSSKDKFQAVQFGDSSIDNVS